MSRTIARYCDHCKEYAEVVLEPGSLVCPHCRHVWGDFQNIALVFENCPVCRCRQFYISKDFNQFLGCAIMTVGIILVPITYGLSLPVFAFMDWLLYRRVPTVINCYKCGGEFRGFENTKNFKPFLHHIGLKYDKYR